MLPLKREAHFHIFAKSVSMSPPVCKSAQISIKNEVQKPAKCLQKHTWILDVFLASFWLHFDPLGEAKKLSQLLGGASRGRQRNSGVCGICSKKGLIQ